jgi:hypothetical protein
MQMNFLIPPACVLIDTVIVQLVFRDLRLFVDSMIMNCLGTCGHSQIGNLHI